ncbi:hypothetical protein [Bifidobacterium sp. ESL0790]|uniref:hypothetical protein n=1 Tax=Bifidobacterium sp. ESL0790 TaxID=2983233 RepID=UPI0023F76950|nr:hypothetical protein [Bifidobacterium sp. ESL0790]WEV72156.1 hypothetical protein OZY47_06865 [Bifidobacterium sp. ESL0790]
MTIDTHPNTPLSWLSVSLVTGEVIAELPDLQCDSIEYHLMEGCTADAALPWDNIPDNWFDALLPGGVALLLVRDEEPLWGGIVTDMQRDADGPSIALKLETIEAYLDSCPVGDKTYTQSLQTEIGRDIVQKWAIDGMRNCLVATADDSDQRRDRTYQDQDDKSVLSAIQELAGIEDGPEWGSWWERQDDGSYRCHIHFSDHYGATEPVTEFSLPQTTQFQLDYQFGKDTGATRVRAVSTADGDTRPSSGWIISPDPYRPVWSLTFTPSTSITDIEQLTGHATAKSISVKDGAKPVNIVLDLLTAPKLGVEWTPGDMVRWDIDYTSDRFPDLSEGVMRIIGYKIEWSGSWTITPITQKEATDGQ